MYTTAASSRQSRLLCNAGASAYNKVELDKLDVARRRHLRLLGVFYPEHMSDVETYERANARMDTLGTCAPTTNRDARE